MRRWPSAAIFVADARLQRALPRIVLASLDHGRRACGSPPTALDALFAPPTRRSCAAGALAALVGIGLARLRRGRPGIGRHSTCASCAASCSRARRRRAAVSLPALAHSRSAHAITRADPARELHEHSAETTPRVFSGMQPTGNLHLGNYLGAMVQLGRDAGDARVHLLRRRHARDHGLAGSRRS